MIKFFRARKTDEVISLLLRRFEAYGFKSFGEKTVVEFGPGITAIVGPNGSGKSNISDGIRWALGEQSVKSIRGAKMEDLIFSGSAARRPLGLAEVTLTFDNSDGSLPIEYGEVTITRRLFRSGESEFFINKGLGRLKDIHDLFADTGLGRGSLFALSQSTIDEVLNSRPEEKRLFFESAAGITRHRQRKLDALRKLEETEHNILRVNDIIAEIESQMEPMARNAAKAERYAALKRELTACQVTLLLDRLASAEGIANSAAIDLEGLENAKIAVDTSLVRCEAQREMAVNALAELQDELVKHEGAISAAATETERVDGRIALVKERLERARTTIAQYRAEHAAHVGRLASLAAEIAASEAAAEAKIAERHRIESSLSELEAEHRMAVSESRCLEDGIEEAKTALFSVAHELAATRNALKNSERDASSAAARRAGLEKERQEYEARLKFVGKELVSAETEEKLTREQIGAIRQESELLTLRRQEAEKTLAVLRTDLERITSALREAETRLRTLQALQNEYEGYGRAVKAVLAATESWRKGVFGAIGQLIRVEEKYVAAVETALGAALQNLVTNDEDTAKQAILFLKNRGAGRATFMPLTAMRPAKIRDYEFAAAHEPGALGFVAEFVRCEERFRPAIEFLLGRTVLAENLDAAIAIARRSGFSVRIVTLDGDQVNPGGTMTGGSISHRGNSVLSRAAEIAALKTKVLREKENTSSLAKTIKGKEAERLEIEAELARLAEQQTALKIALVEAKARLDKRADELKHLEQALTAVNAELCSWDGDRNAAIIAIQSSQAQIAALEARDRDLKQLLAEKQSQLRQCQEKQARLAKLITDSKIAWTAVSKDVEAFEAGRVRLEKEIAKAREEKDVLADKIAQQEIQVEELKHEIANLELERTKLSEKRRVHEEARTEKLKAKQELLAAQQKADREARDLRRRQNDLAARLQEVKLLYTHHLDEVKHCSEQLNTLFGMDRKRAEEMRRAGTPEELAADAARLEAEISELGPVNPNAIEEYRRIMERHDFLKGQCSDLEQARTSLLKLVNEIDGVMAQKLKAAFKSINEHFAEISAQLFGGGQARLQMTQPDNVLETGIEIIVQPPGKRPQNLALLSTGERAVTIIALLFSFLRYQPAPFCIIDELDAPLDEANLARFCEFLRDYSRNTQFLIATHRKTTMEIADVLHGITMEESGVSRLISVRFLDKVS